MIISISVFGSFLPKIIVSYVSITLGAHSVNHVVRIIGNPASLSTYLLLVVGGIVDEDKQDDLHQEFFDVVLL
jgi:hypothetical protein